MHRRATSRARWCARRACSIRALPRRHAAKPAAEACPTILKLKSKRPFRRRRPGRRGETGTRPRPVPPQRRHVVGVSVQSSGLRSRRCSRIARRRRPRAWVVWLRVHINLGAANNRPNRVQPVKVAISRLHNSAVHAGLIFGAGRAVLPHLPATSNHGHRPARRRRFCARMRAEQRLARIGRGGELHARQADGRASPAPPSTAVAPKAERAHRQPCASAAPPTRPTRPWPPLAAAGRAARRAFARVARATPPRRARAAPRGAGVARRGFLHRGELELPPPLALVVEEVAPCTRAPPSSARRAPLDAGRCAKGGSSPFAAMRAPPRCTRCRPPFSPGG